MEREGGKGEVDNYKSRVIHCSPIFRTRMTIILTTIVTTN